MVYFKRVQRRYGVANLVIVISYLKVDHKGGITCIDLTRMTSKRLLSLGGTPMTLTPATELHWKAAKRMLIKYTNEL